MKLHGAAGADGSETGKAGLTEASVPGRGAPTVFVPQLLNSMCRLLLQCGGGLASFVYSVLSRKPYPEKEKGPFSRELWPMPVPYPEVFKAVGGSGWKKRRTNNLVLILNWLALGRPKCAPADIVVGCRLSRRQWSVVKLLETLVEDGNSIFSIDAEGMGRGAVKAESHDLELAALHRAWQSVAASSSYYCGTPTRNDSGGCGGDFGRVVGQMKVPTNSAAKSVEASRLSFGPAPRFNPTALFDPRTAAMYEDPASFHRSDGLPPAQSVGIRATPEDKIELFKKLAETKRLVPLSDSEVDESRCSGLFCVPKDLARDRLIMDSRPPNSAEIGLNRWTQCSASGYILAGIELEPHEKLLCSGQDVKDFYYQFVVSRRRAARNALCGRLSPPEMVEVFGPSTPYALTGGYVGLSTMAMGDICACEFAQGSHLSLLFRCGALFPDELVRLRSPMPRTLLSIGVIIDDLVMLEKVLRSYDGTSPTAADARMDLVLPEYEQWGLPTNAKKEFRNQCCASFWGVSLDGDKGLLRSSETRLWPLVLVTLRICRLGLVTRSLLESLCGSWLSIFMIRRRLLSLVNLVFAAISACEEPGHVIRLSGSLKSELLTFCVLGQLAVVNLRARTLTSIHATDSSSWGMAAVSAPLDKHLAREALRHSLSRSIWTRLLSPSAALLYAKGLLNEEGQIPNDEEQPYKTHPFWHLLATAPTYSERWRRPHLRQVHINISELAAHLREEKLLADEAFSIRVPYGLDSQVALGSLVKGRSASPQLTSLLSRSIPTVLGRDVYGGYGFFPSGVNPADAPTRHETVPPPSSAFPSWKDDVADGDFEKFDLWFAEVEAAAGLTAKEDFSELGAKSRLVLRPKREKAAPVNEDIYTIPEAVTEVVEEAVPEEACVLSSRALEVLRSFSSEQVIWPARSPRRFMKPGAVDLFSGEAGVARELVKRGCPFVVTFEWCRSVKEDLLDEGNREKIRILVCERAVLLVGSAVICSSFSIAITPPIRSARYVRGLPWMKPSFKIKVKEGNSHSDFMAGLLLDAEAHDVYFWMENPDSSFIWQMRGFKRYRAADSSWTFRTDFCRHGTGWRKRTRVATSLPSLRGLRMLCKCKKKHQQLRGMHPTLRIPWTKVAEPYPRSFSRMIAAAAASDVGWGGVKLDVASCCWSSSLRIGEARNPGPRVRRAPRNFSLEHAPLLQPGTIALGDRCWDAFLVWARDKMRASDPLELFLLVPLFLAHAIRKYGDEQFRSGGALSYYRHLVLAAQRKLPNLRSYSYLCWELATRWEHAEPTIHRQPLPQPLLLSMTFLAWTFGWREWVGIALICFFGVARVGEVIGCLRQHLLLPSDLLEDSSGAAFVLLYRSKTSARHPAKIQHLKITDEYAVKMLEKIYNGMALDRPIYFGSPSMFRRRWDVLLAMLDIPPALRVTPGGLRGGGAVAAYRSSVPISEIQWRMRIRNQVTLEAYIQEVAAVSLLNQLSSDSLKRIRISSQLAAFLVYAG